MDDELRDDEGDVHVEAVREHEVPELDGLGQGLVARGEREDGGDAEDLCGEQVVGQKPAEARVDDLETLVQQLGGYVHAGERLVEVRGDHAVAERVEELVRDGLRGAHVQEGGCEHVHTLHVGGDTRSRGGGGGARKTSVRRIQLGG